MNRIYTVLAAIVGATSAQAGVVIQMGPGNFQEDQNVLYNGPGVISHGMKVQGRTNQTSDIVDFWDAGELLHTPSNGQARVEAVDGELTALRIGYNDPLMVFGTLILNINAVDDGQVTFNVSVNGGPTHVETFALDRSGQNFFRINTTGSDMMTNVYFTTNVGVADIKQVRIGPGSIVPEPVTLAAVGIGVIGLLSRRRRR